MRRHLASLEPSALPRWLLGARERTTSHFRIPASGHLRPIRGREILDVASYACGFAQSDRPNWTQIWARKWEVILSRTLSLLLLLPGLPAFADDPASLLLATTTSVQDSGLLEVLLPEFTEQTGIRVRAVAVGTGAALRMGAEGNADVLLTHAPQAEQALIDSGAVDRRIEFMENYFVLAGPKEDPARVAEAPGVLAALKLIRESGASFVSRGDDSGTHKREVALLRAAGLDPSERFPGLTRTGSGMGLSLQVAGQKSAYILSDIGTFLAFRERIGLVALTREEPALKNIYAVLRVSPERFPRVHAKEASRLADFLRGEVARALIRSFGIDRFGRPLFKPLEPTDE